MANDKEKSYSDYMERVKNDAIPAYESTLGGQELVFLKDIIDRNWLSEGKYTREFESKLAGICQRSHGLSFCNATAALITGMLSMGVKPGDEVIVPSFTHPADPNSISVIGAIPVFADVDETTLCLSVDTISRVVTEKTKAILYVSLYGNTSDLESIVKYAKQKHLILINDCAPALFGTFKGKSIASYGDFSVLSFLAY